MASKQSDNGDTENYFPGEIGCENTTKEENNKLRPEVENNIILEDPTLRTPIFRINSQESLARNWKFLKDLEVAKARLRTYAAYTPTDRELQQRAAEYRKHLPKYM